jgi:hypothetical protein
MHDYVSFAIGGAEERYEALVVFMYELIKVLGKEWKYCIIMEKTDFSEKYKVLLEKFSIVEYLNFNDAKPKRNVVQVSPVFYSIMRFLIHDFEDVRKWVCLDSHYDIVTTNGAKKIKTYLDHWKDSEKPFFGHIWEKRDLKSKRPFAGGLFGIDTQKADKYFHGRKMTFMIDKFMSELNITSKTFKYGDDEIFIADLVYLFADERIEEMKNKSDLALDKKQYDNLKERIIYDEMFYFKPLATWYSDANKKIVAPRNKKFFKKHNLKNSFYTLKKT